MLNLKARRVKVAIRVAVITCLVLLLSISTVGIYYQLKNKKSVTPTTTVNPLEWSVDTWDGKSSSSDEWYSGDEFGNRGSYTYTIDSAESFIYFVNLVNDPETAKEFNYFSGYTIYLNTNIDMAGYSFNSIGITTVDDQNKVVTTFQGTFDGGYYTIRNAIINGTGLFGSVENATICNIGLYNCTINAEVDSYVGGIVGMAVNSNIYDTFIRLGEITGANYIGGLVGKYAVSEDGHILAYSFADTTLSFADETLEGLVMNGIVGELDCGEYQTTLRYCYYTSGNSAYSLASGTDEADLNLTVTEVIRPASLDDFSSWAYSSKYSSSTNSLWCDYSYKEGSEELSFNYPILTNFNKVFMVGSYYENTVTLSDGSVQNVTSLAEAFSYSESNNLTDVITIVDEITVNETAVVSSGATIWINAAKDTIIRRGENLEDAVILVGENSSFGACDDDTYSITIDGNRDYVEANNLKSSALVVVAGATGVQLGFNLQNNVNNTDGKGGLLAIYDSYSEAVKTSASIKKFASALTGKKQAQLVATYGHTDITSATTISSGNYTGGSATYGGGIYAKASLTISGGSIYENSAYYGGGIYSGGDAASLIMKGGSIYSNIATTNGGGIFCSSSSSSLTITGGSIYLNSAANYGGGVYSVASTVSIGEGDDPVYIYGNTVDLGGGGVYWAYGDTCTLGANAYIGGTTDGLTYSSEYGNSTSDTTSTYYGGGGVFFYSGEINIVSGCHICYNTTEAYGGGIYISNSVTSVTFGDIIVSNNSASSYGGGIYSEASLTITGGSIYENSASSRGGGIYTTANLTITDSSIYSNSASSDVGGDGGGIYTTYTVTNLTITDSSIYSNSAVVCGGGIAANSASLTITDCLIYGNSSYNGGGGVWVAYTNLSVTITGTSIYSNSSQSGGGLYVKQTSSSIGSLDLTNSLIYSNTVTNGSGGGLYIAYVSLTGGSIYENIAQASTSEGGGGIYAINSSIGVEGSNIYIYSNKVVCVNANSLNHTGGGGIFCSNSTIGEYAYIGGTTDGVTYSSEYANVVTTTDYTGNMGGGGILTLGSTTINGAHISYNETDEYTVYGGGIYNAGTLTISSATINNNWVHYYGGGIYNYYSTSLTITDCEIYSNTADMLGGGIYSFTDSLTITGGSIYSNEAGNGAGIYLEVLNTGSKVSIGDGDSNVFIYGNTARSYGGGICVGGATDVESVLYIGSRVYIGGTTDGVTFSSEYANEVTTTSTLATYGGAGIYISAGSLVISGNSFIWYNEVNSGYGGGIYITSDVISTTIEKVSISYNTAVNGGGIYCAGELTMSGGFVLYNTASNNGGGVYVSGTFTMNGGDISYNTASSRGGGVYSSGTAYYYGGRILSNTATAHGGGIYATGETTTIGDNSSYTIYICFNTATNNRGGGVYYSNSSGTLTLGQYAYIGGTTNGATFSSSYGNTSGGKGGGVAVESATTVYVYSTIAYNSAGGEGGGLNIEATTIHLYETSEIYQNSSTKEGGGIYASGTRLNLYGDIHDNSGTYGGGVYTTTTYTYMYSGDIYLNNATSEGGGGIYCTGGNCSLLGGSIYSNTANEYGGGVYLSGSTVYIGIDDSYTILIYGNTASTGAGGGVCYNNSVGSLVLGDNATIGGVSNNPNTAGTTGGGIAVLDAVRVYVYCDVAYNTATTRGGGVYIKSATRVFIGSSTITPKIYGNTSGSNGGGICAECENFVLYSAEMYENTAVRGGAISLAVTSTTNSSYIHGGSIHNNEAENGGGIYCDSGTIEIGTSSSYLLTVYSNTATKNGGGIYSYGTITIGEYAYIGGTEDGETFSSTYANTAQRGAGVYIVSGSLTVSGANISYNTASDEAGGIWVASGCSVNLNGTVSYNSAPTGGGVVTAGTTTIEGTVSYNEATAGEGGGIYADGGSLTVSGSVENNTSSSHGGGISITAGVKSFTFTGTVSNNTATYGNGGGIYSLYSVDTTPAEIGGTISGNKAGGSYGAGLYHSQSQGVLSFTKATITSNEFTSAGETYGGGIYILYANSVTISDCFINLNSATYGGGIAVYNPSSTIANILGITGTRIATNQIINNIATYGAGIYFDSACSTSSLTIENVLIENTASQCGGGIYSTSAVTIGSGAEISDNTATNGAGIYLKGNATLTISDGILCNNNASQCGGGIFATDSSKIVMSGGSIYSNNATNGGGVYISSDSATMTMSAGTIYSNEATNGGGIYRDAGTVDLSAVTSSNIYNNTASSSGNNTYGCGYYTFNYSASDSLTVYNFDTWDSASFTVPTASGYSYSYYGYATTDSTTASSTETSGTLYSADTYTSNPSLGTLYVVWETSTWASSSTYTYTFYISSGVSGTESATTTIAYSGGLRYYNYACTSYTESSAATSTSTDYGTISYKGEGSILTSGSSSVTVELDGYSLAGWSEDANSTTASWTSDSKSDIESKTWYAVWYNAEGEYDESETYTHTFYIASSTYGTTTTSTTTHYSSATIYYNYTLANSTTSGGTLSEPVTTTLSYVGDGAVLNSSVTVQNSNGYYLAGWTSTAGGTTPEWTTGTKTPEADTTWYAVWGRSLTYYYSCDNGDGSYGKSVTVYGYYPYTITATSQTLTAESTCVAGYSFYGYSTTKSTTNNVSSYSTYFNRISYGTADITTSSATTTVYQILMRTLKYYYNGTNATVYRYYNYDVEANATYSIDASSEHRSGYDVYGYTTTTSFTNNTTSAPSLIGNENSSSIPTTSASTTAYQVLYRTWKFYNSSASTTTINTYYMYNATADYEYSYTPTTPTLTGYTFYGWSTSDNQPTSVGEKSSIVPTTVANILLTTSSGEWYAIWRVTTGTRSVEEQLTHTFWTGLNASTSVETTKTTSYSGVYVYYSYNLENSIIDTSTGTAGSPTYGVLSYQTASKSDYNFAGWTSTAGGTTLEWTADTKTPEADTTWYAVWSRDAYIRGYYTSSAYNDGETVTSYCAYNGSITSIEASLPANPTRSDYSFVGWTTSQTGTASESISTTVNCSVETSYKTIYAVWSTTETHESNDEESGGTPITHTFYTGSEATLSPSPTTTMITTTTYTGDTKYLNYTLSTYEYANLEAVKTTSYSYSDLAYQTASKSGYTFAGWTSTAGGTDPEWTEGAKNPTSATTWYAVWSRTWNFNDNGTGSSETTYYPYTAVADASSSYSKNYIERTDQNFTGWATNTTGASNSTDGSTTVSMTVAEASWTSSWSTKTYTITIEVSPSGYGTVSTKTLTVDHGTTYSATENTLTIGSTNITATPTTATAQYTYEFSSWSSSSGTITASTTITANFTRTLNQYSVEISASPSAYGSVNVTSVTVYYGSSISTSGNTLTITDSNASKTYNITATPTTATAEFSYAFESWSETSGTVTGAMTITATFTQTRNKYTVSIGVDSSTYGSVDVTSVTVYYGATIEASANVLKITDVYDNDKTAYTITATANSGYAFDYFEQDNSGSAISSTLTVTGDSTITAYFYKTIKVTLSVTDKSNTSSDNTYGYTYSYNGATVGSISETGETYIRSGSIITLNADATTESDSDGYYTVYRVTVELNGNTTTSDLCMGKGDSILYNGIFKDEIESDITISFEFTTAYAVTKTTATDTTTEASVSYSSESSYGSGDTIYIETGAAVTITMTAPTSSSYDLVAFTYYTDNSSTDGVKLSTYGSGNENIEKTGDYTYKTELNITSIVLDVRKVETLNITTSGMTENSIAELTLSCDIFQKTITSSATSVTLHSGDWIITAKNESGDSVTLSTDILKAIFETSVTITSDESNNFYITISLDD